MTIWCPICKSDSPESQAWLRWIARKGLARFLRIARTQRVIFAREQKRDICDALLTWDACGAPSEIDWLVHEHAIRAAWIAEGSHDAAPGLIDAMESGPGWNANFYKEGTWDCEAEHVEAKQMEILFGEAPEDK